MHDDRIGARLDRRIEQLDRCRDACCDATDIRASFHLQPVWAIIAELGDVEVLAQVVVQLLALHRLFPGEKIILAEQISPRAASPHR